MFGHYSYRVKTVVNYNSSLIGFITFHKASTTSMSTSENDGLSMAVVICLDNVLEAGNYAVDP